MGLMRDTKNKAVEPSQVIDPDLPEEDPGVGRKSLFNPEYTHIAMVMCEQGFRTLDLARAFRVEKNTVTNWMRRYPDFKDAIVAGRDHFNMQQAEAALVKRVTGYDYKETVHEAAVIGRKITDIVTGKKLSEDEYASKLMANAKNAKETIRIEQIKGMVLKKITTKHVAPSDRALEYFLNNRARFAPTKSGEARWAHNNHLEVTGKDGAPLIPGQDFNPEKFLAEMLVAQRQSDDVIEAEVVEAKQLGVETNKEPHSETEVPDAR